MPERTLTRQSKSVDAPNEYTARSSTARPSVSEHAMSTQQSSRVFISEGTSYTQLNQYLLKDEIGKVMCKTENITSLVCQFVLPTCAMANVDVSTVFTIIRHSDVMDIIGTIDFQ